MLVPSCQPMGIILGWTIWLMVIMLGLVVFVRIPHQNVGMGFLSKNVTSRYSCCSSLIVPYYTLLCMLWVILVIWHCVSVVYYSFFRVASPLESSTCRYVFKNFHIGLGHPTYPHALILTIVPSPHVWPCWIATLTLLQPCTS